MKKAKLSRAEQLRRHREIFEYARAHGLTLKAAELAMLREARAARLARMNRCGRAIAPAPAATLADRPLRPIPADAPWMLRN
jgi:hypothetical protein